jgi:electron transfer flavoprotein alpha subunit
VERDRILVAVQKKGIGTAQAASISLENLKTAWELSRQGDGEIVCACVLGSGIDEFADEMASYVDEVYAVDNPLLSRYQADLYACALEAVCRAVNPRTVLMGHTYENREVGPKLGCKMGKDLITDCVKIERDRETGALLCTKPVYGGNAVAVFDLLERPQMVTIRSKITEALQKSPAKGLVTQLECELVPAMGLTESLGLVPGEEAVNLSRAEVIVAGGRGVKTVEDLEKLKGLAAVLRRRFKVEMGASRAVVDAGLMPHSRQIGQTGEKVSPQLYIAVAISGAAQHMAGITGAKKILTINKDAGAAIFGSSDYGVVGQYEDIVPALIKKLEELS